MILQKFRFLAANKFQEAEIRAERQMALSVG